MSSPKSMPGIDLGIQVNFISLLFQQKDSHEEILRL